MNRIPEVLKKDTKLIFTKDIEDKIKSRDIIVNKIKWETIIGEDGTIIKKRKNKKINLTKKMNETKKLIKNDNAAKKLAELEEILNKE